MMITSRPNPVLSPVLSTVSGLKHAFFTREGGASTGVYASLNGGQGSNDAPESVQENRARMAAHFGVAPDQFVSLYQIHSPICLPVDAVWDRDNRPQADAMATARPGIVLGIGTADCGPILFVDPVARVIGAAHAGWKGAFGGVLEATLARMEEMGAQRARIIAVLGPMLSQANYEVGPEFQATFLAQSSENERFFVPGSRQGHPHFDLPGYIENRLHQAGVGTVENLGLCTYADETRFYSYRRMTHRKEPDYGRLIAAIMLS